ncbi:tripartite tricarboxylate transporter substrate binding protein [Caenimonas koreensis DSM 17982]|uniref:Tripartite tricarboxylate transporter substrate binding protein n=1 Tax=Caenimonas koreensis DSM 17982 TaxID=1121255 RepID=A0A844BEX8_9BURK|nr:tripartite tricarboxylate transporter substrate binding protein [Caenimonas koreensis]MRD49011.1 tripartite tricarboxylate transporter substrate binding protein [Caenimonas koreensis DSM 17982]
MTITRRTLLTAGAALPFASALHAQTWPGDQTIKVMVPFPPGGSTDIIGRMVAEHLQKQLSATVIVENLPGATGTIGVAAVARAKPDGYTLLMGSVGTMVTNHFAYEKLPFTIDSIAPVINLAETPNVLMVRPDLPVKTPGELIAYMKANPGKLQYGSSGIASSAHVACELLKLRAGVDAVHVPYKGGTPMLNDLMAGTIDFSIDQISSALKLMQAGRIRALAVASRTRSTQLPGVPTLAETIPDFVSSPWFCVGAPAGTPRPVIMRVNTALNSMLADKAVLAKLEGFGILPVGGTPEDLAALMKREAAQMRELSTRVNLRNS